MSTEKRIPQHIAIIMDGNGRWAQLRGKERVEGHMQGVDSVRKAIRSSIMRNVKYLTLYAFSTENWGRPAAEVEALMEILCKSIMNETPELKKEGVRVTIIGDKTRFSENVNQSLNYIEEQTQECDKLRLSLALNYSSRDEIRRVATEIAKKVQAGELSAEDISEEVISNTLDTQDIPDPDLIIRTSGECRLSNFMMWQAAYAELLFTDVLWPDFDLNHFDAAIEEYGQRDRRFGKLK